MATKKARVYKALDTKKTAQVKTYTKAGKNQEWIAKKLCVSKQRVANAQKTAKIGKRVSNEFWNDVTARKRTHPKETHKERTKAVKKYPIWKEKRDRKTHMQRVRKLRKAGKLPQDMDMALLEQHTRENATKRGWYSMWEVQVCNHSPPCLEGELSWWEPRRQYLWVHKEDVPDFDARREIKEEWYAEQGDVAAKTRNFGIIWID